ncbi:MAG: hypothetical protein LBI79_01640 [Nitrososphaerota archaeon]|nr:hypothetical protein [Nitrososphaerota archaeon]
MHTLNHAAIPRNQNKFEKSQPYPQKPNTLNQQINATLTKRLKKQVYRWFPYRSRIIKAARTQQTTLWTNMCASNTLSLIVFCQA